MNYRIITDTGCDLPEKMYDQLELIVAPLTVTYKGQDYNTYTESWLKEMFDGLRNGESTQTCAINPEGWKAVIQPVLEAGQDVLVMTFSSGLSTTYQSAVIAAEELAEQYPQQTINVVDTLGASLGQGLMVFLASQKRSGGMSLQELTQWLEENKQHLCHWFTVDDLMYLKRGGRISAATALVGTMLQIKPVLHVDAEGHLVNVAKARGRKASIEMLAKKLDDTITDRSTAFISHGDCLEDARYLEKILKEKYGVKDVFIYYVGAVIGSHSGPGTLALFYTGTQR